MSAVAPGQEEPGDGSHILYVNGAFQGSDALGAMLQDLRCSSPEKMQTGFLRKAAMRIKNSEDSLFAMKQRMEREYLKSKGLDQKI